MKNILVVCLIISAVQTCFAQHSDESARVKQLNLYQDSLKILGKQMKDANVDLERKNANVAFIKTLGNALKINNSFMFKFDSVKTISVLNSPDNKFRIFSWYIQYEDGSYRFYGTLQMNTGGPLTMYPLVDYSPLLKNPEDSISSNKKWFGAMYYKIIPVYGTKPHYVLLGWKGNTVVSTKKVIEVLSFKDNRPELGLPVFDGNGKTRKRVVFEYSRQASMLLRYEPEQNLIVFDHLAPPDKKLKDKPQTYGPDLSYDGYKLKNGRWEYVDNIDMKNIPESRDDQFIDPGKKAGSAKNKVKQ